MKKGLLVVLLAAAPVFLSGQEPRSRGHREAAADAQAGARERVGERSPADLRLSRRDLDLFEHGGGVELSVRRADGTRDTAARWESDNPRVARVNERGLVSPTGLGQARIRAFAADGRRSNDCAVTVSKPNHWGSVSGTDTLVVQGGWVYFAHPADGGKLYRVRTDGSRLGRLSDDEPCHLNVAGRRIYYYNGNRETGYGLYTMTIDGEERTCLNDRDSITCLRVNRHGWAYYLNERGEVFSLRTHKPGEAAQKVFDGRPVHSMAVNDFHIFYNRHWEDIVQPRGAGGVFSYSLKSKKVNSHLSVNVNTSPVILDQDRDDVAYYCSYGDHGDVAILPGIDHSPSEGWFRVLALDREEYGTGGPLPDGLISRVKLVSGDSIQWAAGGWIYYTRGRELRRMQTDGKRDQLVLAPRDEVVSWHWGGERILFWSAEGRLFRALPDGRVTEEIAVAR